MYIQRMWIELDEDTVTWNVLMAQRTQHGSLWIVAEIGVFSGRLWQPRNDLYSPVIIIMKSLHVTLHD